MLSTTVRISEASRKALGELAAREGQPMQTVLEKAIELYRRQRFLEEVNTAFEKLRQDPEAWAAVEQERVPWEATLGDGLPPGEAWTEDGEAVLEGPKDR